MKFLIVELSPLSILMPLGFKYFLILENKGKESENSYQKLKRSP